MEQSTVRRPAATACRRSCEPHDALAQVQCSLGHSGSVNAGTQSAETSDRDSCPIGQNVIQRSPSIDDLISRCRPELDADGRLLSPPLVDPHVHMDAVLTVGESRHKSGTLLRELAHRKAMLTLLAATRTPTSARPPSWPNLCSADGFGRTMEVSV